MRAAARRGLELRKKHGKGGLSTQEAGKQGIGSGVARATSLANGEKVSYETIKRMAAFFSRHEKNKSGGEDDAGRISWMLWGSDAGRAWASRIIKMVENRKKRPMSEYVRVIEEEDEGIGLLQALSILSANEHRNTSRWELVEKQCFKNGRLDETHIYVMSVYDKPDEHFEPTKFLTFEIEAMAKSYVMEGIEAQLSSIRDEDDDDD